MNNFANLIKIFKDYKIYPKSRFIDKTFIRKFIEIYPNDSYSKDILRLIEVQDINSNIRGADLPWWGKKYFTDTKITKKTFIISQDSDAVDAGSVVFHACIIPYIKDNANDKELINKFNGYGFYKPVFKLKNIFMGEWNINLDYTYITDAKKVFTDNNKLKKNFDIEKSHELIIKEIEVGNPDIIVLLGNNALHCLVKDKLKLKKIKNKPDFDFNGKRCIFAPFPVGQGARWFVKQRRSDLRNIFRTLYK